MAEQGPWTKFQPDASGAPAEGPWTKFQTQPGASTPQTGDAFFGAAGMLPESIQRFAPGFLKGPSVGEQLTTAHERVGAQEQRLGRPLTLKERLAAEPLTESPVAMGFATHQIGDLGEAVAAGNAAAAENFINHAFARAAKPGVSGKQTAAQLGLYNERARNAITSIVENKTNLRFTDPATGQVTTGELPKTLEQFADAIDQTKQAIFQRYDALARQTQAAGMEVSLMPAAAELQKIANDPITALMHPELVKYAQERADAFSRVGQIPASDAQRAITTLNSSLKAFYRNPDYSIAGRANVDAMVANQLRSSLDQAVENVVGPGYQELKDQYGALKAIEKDVVNRAQVVKRQEAGGGLMGRIADVASAEEVLRGLATFSPGAVIRGAALKGWAEYVKHLRSPNRAVTKLFEAAEGQQNPQPPPRPIVPNIPISPIFPTQNQSPGASAMGLQ